MTHPAPYPVGTPGTPWGEIEKAAWLARQSLKRSYADEVLAVIDALHTRFDVEQYGQLDHHPGRYPLLALRSHAWDDALPIILVSGGVHG